MCPLAFRSALRRLLSRVCFFIVQVQVQTLLDESENVKPRFSVTQTRVTRAEKDYGLPRLTIEEAARVVGVHPGAFWLWVNALKPKPTPGQLSKWGNDTEPLPEAILRLYLTRHLPPEALPLPPPSTAPTAPPAPAKVGSSRLRREKKQRRA